MGSAQVDARGGLIVGAKDSITAAGHTKRSGILRSVGVVSVNPPAIITHVNGSLVIDTSAPNVDDFIEGKVGDLIFMVAPNDLEAGLVLAGVSFTDTNEVTMLFGNLKAATVDGVARDWAYLVFDMT